MILHVHLFAGAKDLAGTNVVAVNANDCATVGELRSLLARSHPRLAGLLQRSALAVNSEFAGQNQVLNAGDEIAVLPPVSGG